MQNSNEVIDKILNFAQIETNVRAVVMNGSRVNPNALKDEFQDYDIVFYVLNSKEEKYKLDQSWIDNFGKLVICQQNDFEAGYYIFLMQFFSGVRIDLCFRDISTLNNAIKEDSLTEVLLDKDNRIRNIPIANELTYFVRKPTGQEWDDCLNELFWIQICIIKAIVREEILLAHYFYTNIFISEIQKLVSWHIGYRYKWEVNIGKAGKWILKYLEKSIHSDFIRLFKLNTIDDYFENIKVAQVLIQCIGSKLGHALGYKYPEEYANNVIFFLDNFDKIYNQN